MTVGCAGLAVAVNAVTVAATPPEPPNSFRSAIQARGTLESKGKVRLEKGLDIVAARNEIDPGGTSGWHSHPGGAILIIQQGEVTLYRSAGNHCNATRYTAGQSFVERPAEVVNAKNTGSVLTVLFVTYPGVPVGGSPRTDEPAPTCTGSDQGHQGE
jgi:quercetin dioxygenase-like cupin family protein